MAYTHGSAGVGGNGATGPGTHRLQSPGVVLERRHRTSRHSIGIKACPASAAAHTLRAGFGVGFTTTNPTGALSATYVDPELSGRPPYYMNWSFGFQRELPGSMTLGVDLLGQRGPFPAPQRRPRHLDQLDAPAAT